MQRVNERPLWKSAVKVTILLLLLILIAVVFQSLNILQVKFLDDLAGVTKENDLLKYLGFGIGGLVLILQALIADERAAAIRITAEAQASAAIQQAKATEQQANANRLAEQGLRQERFKNAIEHLGHQSDSVRSGGAYELFNLARDTQDQDAQQLRQTVLDILCAHIRWTTGNKEYQKIHEWKPSEEIQSLLTLLFVQEHAVFNGLQINLQDSWLNGADLHSARMEDAVMRRANLRAAHLDEADLRNAMLWQAHLQGADFTDADLRGAWLLEGKLHGARLGYANLGEANLEDAHLQGASFFRSNLQGARLMDAHMQGAILDNARLLGASLKGALLQGANLLEAQLQDTIINEARFQGAGVQEFVHSTTFAQRLKMRIGQESDLSRTIFAGGLDPSDMHWINRDATNYSVNVGLAFARGPDAHFNQPPEYGLPENRHAVTGVYTEEQAEQWIAEYEEAMSGVPGDRS